MSQLDYKIPYEFENSGQVEGASAEIFKRAWNRLPSEWVMNDIFHSAAWKNIYQIKKCLKNGPFKLKSYF